MIKTGNPDYVAKGLEGKSKLQEQMNYAKIMGYDMAPPAAAPAAAPAAGTPMGMPAAAPAPGTQPVNALAATMTPNQTEIVTKINRLLALGTPQAIQTAKILQSQIKTEAPKAGVVVGAKGTLVNPVTGEVIYRNTSAEEPVTGLSKKETQKLEAAYPKATLNLKSFESSSDNLIKDMIRLRDHPGLSSITGVLYGRTPSLTKDGREAQALYDKILARGGFQELQNMRNASPTGGALGNVSNQEGTQLRQAFGALDRTQEASSVQNELDRLVENVTGATNRVREAYDMTYEYKGGGATTKPNTPPTLDQLLEKYK
jgi:hypothetical protein